MFLLDGIEYAARDGVAECPAMAALPVVAGDRTDLRPEAARQLVVHSRAYPLDDAPEIGAVATFENSKNIGLMHPVGSMTVHTRRHNDAEKGYDALHVYRLHEILRKETKI